MPNPNVMAAAIAQRTSRARIAVFGNALPLRSTPLASIEEYTMIDLLSNGRLEAGFVVGGGPEYYNFSINPTSARDRFAEGLALARRAWAEPGPFRWDGEHYQLDCVNPWPRPIQQPHPPIWMCGVGSPTTLEMCARENLGYMGVNVNTGHADFVGQCEYFRNSADRYGHAYDPAKMGWLTHIHVADDDEQALAEFSEPRGVRWVAYPRLRRTGKDVLPTWTPSSGQARRVGAEDPRELHGKSNAGRSATHGHARNGSQAANRTSAGL